jgi:tellurite resistance protein TerC
MLTLGFQLFSSSPLAMVTMNEFIAAIPIIISLIIIEGLLSVDNALAIAAMASHLPEKQKVNALRFGILGAYLFRGLTLAVVAWIIANQWIKWIGAAYLIYLMCSHLSQDEEGGEEGTVRHVPNFWMTVLQIEIMDLSLSIDNVVAAVALSKELWIVVTGVFIGILALRLLAGFCIKLIEKFPILGKTAFLLVGYVGFLLVYELTMHALGYHDKQVGPVGKFIGICIIVAVTILYDKTPGLQRALRPLIAASLAVMGVFAKIFEVILWLPKQVFRVVREVVGHKTPPPADDEVLHEAAHDKPRKDLTGEQ